MFSAEVSVPCAAFNPLRRPEAINMQADAHALDQSAALQQDPSTRAEATPPPNPPQWGLQRGPPTATPCAPIPAAPAAHLGALHCTSPAVADMGALWKYLDYCGTEQRQLTAVQVLAQQPEDVLAAFAGRIHQRVAELRASEAVESQRARVLGMLAFGHVPLPCSDVQPACRESTTRVVAANAGCDAAAGPVLMVVDPPARYAAWPYEPAPKRLHFCSSDQGAGDGPTRSGGDMSEAEPQQADFALRNAAQYRLRVTAPAQAAVQ